VVVKVMIRTATTGAKALSSLLMPACGIATAIPTASEKASTR
jgi:hypothetical protein